MNESNSKVSLFDLLLSWSFFTQAHENQTLLHTFRLQIYSAYEYPSEQGHPGLHTR